MIDHLSIGTTNLGHSIAFYENLFAPLGFNLQHRTDAEASFGPESSRTFWLYPVDVAAPLNGMHIAFTARTAEAVNDAFAAAMRSGATAVREPGRRPDISDEYYGTVILDPSGHKLEIVTYVAA